MTDEHPTEPQPEIPASDATPSDATPPEIPASEAIPPVTAPPERPAPAEPVVTPATRPTRNTVLVGTAGIAVGLLLGLGGSQLIDGHGGPGGPGRDDHRGQQDWQEGGQERRGNDRDNNPSGQDGGR